MSAAAPRIRDDVAQELQALRETVDALRRRIEALEAVSRPMVGVHKSPI